MNAIKKNLAIILLVGASIALTACAHTNNQCCRPKPCYTTCCLPCEGYHRVYMNEPNYYTIGLSDGYYAADH
jgi:hypothetical protein